MTRLHFLLALVLLSSRGWAVGGAAFPDAVSALVHTGEVSCRPTLRYFCKNIHIGCSGRTSIKTFPFTLQAAAKLGGIKVKSRGFVEFGHFREARIDWATDSTYVILHPTQGAGYIKLLRNGKYSFRHYSRGVAVMSYGHCD